MARQTFDVFTCDRCGFSVESREGTERKGWGVLGAAEWTFDPDKPGRRVGDGVERPGDLCPGCIELLFAWWQEPGQVDQPSPPAPPPPPAKPVLDLMGRKRAIEQTLEALRLRTAFALQVVREQPTEILSGELIPGTLFGIDDTAEGIVDGVLDAVGFEGYRRGPDLRVFSARLQPRPIATGSDEGDAA